jgi:predicted transglutaminase-like cysteine proteinase
LALLLILYSVLTVVFWLVRRLLVFADEWESVGFADLDVGVHGLWPYQWFLVAGIILLIGAAFDSHGQWTSSIVEALGAAVAILAGLLGPPPGPNPIDDYDPLPLPMPAPPKPVPEPSPGPEPPSPSDVIPLTMSWFFRKEPGTLDAPAMSYEVSIDASKSRYETLLAKEHGVRAVGDYGRFVRDGLTPEVCETASQIRRISEKDRLGTILEINNVLAFAQRFSYALDSEDKGVPEYPKYPLETMVEDRGDCEDHAIVAAACLVRLGYDVRLVSLEYGSGPGHMALAVAGAEELPDAFALRDPVSGRKFYYCEATTDAGSRNPNAAAFRMGEVPDRDRSAKMELVSVV